MGLGSSVGQAQEAPPPLPPLSGTPMAASIEAGAPQAHQAAPIADTPATDKTTTAHFISRGAPGDGIVQASQVPSRLQDRGEYYLDFSVVTELPGPEQMFRRESEKEYLERLKLDYGTGPGKSPRVIFPENPPLTTDTYQKRSFSNMVEGVEPSFLCHGRLFFEQKNFDRGGWDLGILTPLVNMGVYYYDLAMLPYHAMTHPFQTVECSAGKCLPGDRTPLYLYHDEFSVTGLVGEATVVTGLFFLFP
jgi:hypothetical protein